MTINRYSSAQQMAESPRATEYRALGMVTGKLIAARDGDRRALIDACHLNEKLWTIFQSDLVTPENGLPNALKAQLISLAIWVQRYTAQVMRGDAPVDPLIDVNKTLMEGLVDSTPVKAATPRPPTGEKILTSA